MILTGTTSLAFAFGRINPAAVVSVVASSVTIAPRGT